MAGLVPAIPLRQAASSFIEKAGPKNPAFLFEVN
jgi:hypothetical protein